MCISANNDKGTAEVEAHRDSRRTSPRDQAQADPRSDRPPPKEALTRSDPLEDRVARMCADALGRGVPSSALPPSCADVIGSLQPTIDPATVASRAVARLPLPSPEPKIGPDPSVNQWHMVAVGYPLWLWTPEPREHAAAVTEQGITITIDARLRTTTFNMGDGHIKTCESSTPYGPQVRPGQESPTCGYRYQRASRPRPYTVSATSHWDVQWTALGQTGTMTIDRTGSRTLEVGELLALRTR